MKIIKRFFYHYPGSVIAYDIYAKNLLAARQALREYLKLTRLPNGTQI